MLFLDVRALLGAALFSSIVIHSAAAQTREQGPWWPHPIWGAGDQAGASNWITPDKIIESIKLVKTGKVYELGHIYEASMPLIEGRSYTMKLVRTSGPAVGTNNAIFNSELLVTEIGQVGTQFDSFGHPGMRLEMADGTTKDVYYNGFTGDEIYSETGLLQLGVENVKPIVTRGLLVDIAAYKGLDQLAEAYEVKLADVRGALKLQGQSEDDLKAGDALLFRFGWESRWKDESMDLLNAPGIGLEVARWIVERKISLVGGDVGPEVFPNPDPDLFAPVHQELVMKNGIFLLESMALDELARDRVYEFLFIFTPLRIKGATGSPGRPIAIS